MELAYALDQGNCIRSRIAAGSTPYDELKAMIAHRHLPTAEHSIRVRVCATNVARSLGLSGRDLTNLSIAAEIHDIGKLMIPTDILDKREALTEAELSVIREHPVNGARLASLAFPAVPEIRNCVWMHHERLDGSGYPNGVTGDEMTRLSRILAVADAFTALTEERPYRRAYSQEQALDILTGEDRRRYDQDIVRHLTSVV